jgi:truncated hemoglobin YjbI
MSLYDDLGGAAAVKAALDKFYPKVVWLTHAPARFSRESTSRG